MKERKVLLYVIVMITLSFLSSCAYEEVLKGTQVPQEISCEVRFSSNINNLAPLSSRLIGEEWESGDEIGSYMFEKEGLIIADGKSNIRYITEKGGYIGRFNAHNDAILLPEDGRKVRFMSYYPYKESINDGVYKIDVSNQISQKKLDFFYSFNSSATYDKSFDADKIPIVFKNQMSKIIINIRNGADLEGYHLMNMNVYLSGFSTNADFDLYTGKIKNYAEPSPIYPCVFIAGKGNVYRGEVVVIPTSDISNAKIVIDLNNGNEHKESYIYTWNLNRAPEKGKRYTYDLTVSSTGITVNSSIHNWNSLIAQEEGS